MEEPDRGYAWVVLCCACLINALLSGMARMIGMLYVAVIEAYQVTRQEASLPFTVRNAVRYLAGPVAGVLGQTYGIRAVSFWGGVVAAAGSALCALAPTVEWIVFFWGVVHGLGFALANTLFQVVINQYFERHRASASGIVLSGACVGALLFPFLIDVLLEEYGTRGCFLLLGGLFLHVLPPSLGLKVPPWVQFPEAYARKRALLLNLSPIRKWDGVTDKPIQDELDVFMNEKSKGWAGKSCVNRHNVICTIYRSFDTDQTPRPAKIQAGIDNAAYVPEPDEKRPEVVAEEKKKGPSAGGDLLRNVRQIPVLYLNPVYVLISVTVAAYFGAFLPVCAVIVDYARDKGIPAHAEKLLIYALTLGDLMESFDPVPVKNGRLCFGWITDRGFVGLPLFMTMTFLAKGAFLLLLTLSECLLANLAVLALYGVTAGVAMVYFPILVHNYVEQSHQTLGIGCIGLLSSVATFGLPPLIGHFRDDVGSYDGLFYIIAAISAVTGALWLLVPVHKK